MSFKSDTATVPTFSPNQIPEIALSWLRAGRGVCLATVVETWGSAPRSPGSQMVVDASGAMMTLRDGKNELAVEVQDASGRHEDKRLPPVLVDPYPSDDPSSDATSAVHEES